MIAIYAILLGLTEITVSDGSTSSLIYKENLFRTDQLCPDLQESLRSQDIDTANYPYKSVFKLAEHISGTTDPCIFESKGPKKQITTVIIKAVHADNKQWNFTGSQPCSEHIKLRLPNTRIFGEVRRPLCSVSKPRNPSRDIMGPLYNPYVWQLSRGKMGISFSMFENDNNYSGRSDDTINNEILSSKDVQLNTGMPRFIQIVFASFFGDSCSLRVQQYLVDPVKEHCNSTSRRFYQLCGMYDCTEEEALLSQIGFWSESLRVQQIHKLIDFVRMKHYRSHEPTLMDFVVGLLRLLIMPIVFLVAYYVTRQLRQKLASRQLLRQLRTMSQQVNGQRMLGARVGSVMIDSPTSIRRDRLHDPPPSYDTIISPPSYQEATTNAKPSDGLHKVISTNSLPSYSTLVIESTNGFAQSTSAGVASVVTATPTQTCTPSLTSQYQQRDGNSNSDS